jgi:D-arabinitol dehydrogenase (NADP+)
MLATNGTTNGAPAKYDVPKEMKAIRYNKVKDFSLVTMPVPEPKAHEILIKGMLNLLSLTFKL